MDIIIEDKLALKCRLCCSNEDKNMLGLSDVYFINEEQTSNGENILSLLQSISIFLEVKVQYIL